MGEEEQQPGHLPATLHPCPHSAGLAGQPQGGKLFPTHTVLGRAAGGPFSSCPALSHALMPVHITGSELRLKAVFRYLPPLPEETLGGGEEVSQWPIVSELNFSRGQLEPQNKLSS